MDNLTHSLVGALIGQAGLKRKTGLAMPALIFGANLPDIDAGCVVFGVESLAMRRGITHGPIAWFVLPLALAGILWRYDKWQARRGKRPEGRTEVRFGWLYALAFIACLTHPALDWLNNYGIRLLEPFSSEWFYGDTLFIIDVWLWALLGFATWLSLRRERRGMAWRFPAVAALAGTLAYIGLNGLISSHFRQIGIQVAGVEPSCSKGCTVISSPVPLRFWDRQLLIGNRNGWWEEEVYGDQLFSVRLSNTTCAWPDMDRLKADRPDLADLLFWSRAPFAERAPDGEGIILSDARFASLGRSGFSVTLPGIPCRKR
jgi:inner membrane protein